jgi:hypothetical protein
MVFKKIALAFGITIILPMMIYHGVSTFVPKPKSPKFDPERLYETFIAKTPDKGAEARAKATAEDERYDKELRHHEIVLFFVSVPIGIIAIILGAFLSVKAIGAGLIFGGIFSVCQGYFNYWSELSNGLRFISLLVAFIVLIFVGYKKIEPRTSKANPG